MLSSVLFLYVSLWMISITTSKPYNVLFIVSDDLRPEFGGAYGKNEVLYTPNIEAFMNRAFTFTQAYTQYALCSPSRTSFLTGLRPDTTKIWEIGPYFRDTMINGTGKDIITLPQYFKEHGGYLTVGAGKVFHCGTSSGSEISNEGGADMPYSWSEPYWFCDQFYNGTVQSTKMQQYPNGTGCVQSDQCIQCLTSADPPCITPSGHPSYCMADCADDCYPDGLVAEQALNYFKRVSKNRDKPWFIGLGFKRPHLGFFAPTKYFDMYDPDSIEIATHQLPINCPPWALHNCIANSQDVKEGNHSYEYKYTWNNTKYNVKEIEQDYQPILLRGYYAAVSFMDAQFGKVMQGLFEYDLWNDTIIVFTGDHGWSLGEEGNWCKQTVFELSARVPLIIRVPKNDSSGTAYSEGKYSNYNVEQLDMFPTIVDASGLGFNDKLMSQLQGKSLLDIIKGKKPSFPNLAYSQHDRNVSGELLMGLSMRNDVWRYTEWHPFIEGDNMTESSIKWDIDKGIELYNHSMTIDENNGNEFEYYNLAYETNMSSVIQELSKQLRETWDNQTWSIQHQYNTNKSHLETQIKLF